MEMPSDSSVLTLLDMTSHSSELVSRSGLTKEVKIVVKGSPFHVNIGNSGPGGAPHFARVAFSASLVYDCEPIKSVDFVKTSPLEFKYSPNAAGDRLDAEFRIKVLTSQHEDMLFKILVQGVDPITKLEYPGLFLVTPAIRVISKPEQIKKRQQPAVQHAQQPAPKKRAIAVAIDPVADALQRLEAGQQATHKLLERIVSERLAAPVKPEFEPVTAPDTFEAAFLAMFRAFQQLPPDAKADSIRRAVRSAAPSEVDAVSELVDLVASEGLCREPSTSSSSGSPQTASHGSPASGCECHDCPHKRELERVDLFYQHFLEKGPMPAADGSAPFLGGDVDFSTSFLTFV